MQPTPSTSPAPSASSLCRTALVLALTAAGLSACGGGGDTTSTTTSTATSTTTIDTSTPATSTGTTSTGSSTTTGTSTATGSTAGVLCAYSHSAFNASASVNATSTYAWTCNTTTRSLVANGLPDHAVGTFPNPDNPNTITAQTIAASLSLTPTSTTVATAMGGPRGVLAFAINGVKFDPGTGGTCNDSGSDCPLGPGGGGRWNIEAFGQSSFKFGTDSNNAHVQPDGVYHYHGMPEGLISGLGKGQAMTLIAWAADGFPIYARYGYTTATDATSAIKLVSPSYRLKTTPDVNRPATSLYPMGTFTQDHEYVAGLGDLDECNGRTGVTPEFPGGIYHYFATDAYPFVQRCVKGQV